MTTGFKPSGFHDGDAILDLLLARRRNQHLQFIRR